MNFDSGTFGFSKPVGKKPELLRLNYDIAVEEIKDENKVRDYGKLGMFSLSGGVLVLTRYIVVRCQQCLSNRHLLTVIVLTRCMVVSCQHCLTN